METDQFFLILYILAWAITLIIYLKKKKTFDAGACLIMAYLVYAVFSYFAYNTNHVNAFQKLKLFPFIYLYLSVIMVMYPVLSTDTSERVILKYPDIKLFKYYSLFIILFSFVQLPDIITHFREGLIRILSSDSGGADLYAETLEMIEDTGHGITNLFAILSGAFKGVAIISFFYSLTIPNLSRVIKISLLVPCLLGVMNGIATGERGAMIQPLLVMLVTFFALYKHIPEKTNMIIRRLGVILAILISVPFLALTFSRFGYRDQSVNESILNYAGQSSLYFNNYALDDGGIRYGDRTIPLFKRMIGVSNVPRNFIERRNKYPNLRINDEVFCTFVGDIAIDFGPVLGFLIMLCCTTFLQAKTRPRNKTLSFHHIILLHFIMYLCIIGGLKLFPFSDTGGNLKLVVYFCSYLLFKYYSNIHVQH